MAFVIADRVKETSTTTGTGTLSLDGAATGYQTFVAGIATTNKTYYGVQLQGGSEWEVGIGTVTDATPDTLTRDVVLYSSNSNAAVDFSAGTKDVWCDAPADLLRILRRVNPNLLYNGGMRVSQRLATTVATSTTPITGANNDSTYQLDRWCLLSDGNDIVDVSQELTTIPSGAYAAIELDVETANKKFGILQILETKDCQGLIGNGRVSLSFDARTSGGTSMANLRAYVLSWAGTADSPTRDIVSAWGTAGTDLTPVANWTIENTPSQLALSNTAFTRYEIPNIAIDTASVKQIAVFIECDDVTTTVGEFLYISKVKLEVGRVCTDFEDTPYSDDVQRCQRYYEKSYGATEATPTGAPAGWEVAGVPSNTVANNHEYGTVKFRTLKRATPTALVYPYTTPANTARVSNYSGTDLAADSGRIDATSDSGFVPANGSGGNITTTALVVIFNWSADAEF